MNQNKQNKILITQRFAEDAHAILKRAFWGKSTAIAANFTALGKPMQPRSVRKMTEASADVRRRNILENTIIMLGAASLESNRTFDFIWQSLASFAGQMRGDKSTAVRNAEEAFSELRFANASLERAFIRGELKNDPQPLLFAGDSLRGLFAHLNVNLSEEQEAMMFSLLNEEANDKPLLYLPGMITD